ncbi:Peptidoglycan glycosyltransferase MrdB [bioreactor metagenome]|uniref:Peptidoglycan glycosyltransferase MrdB n=1 Tax=bioreactor metagenome TaxID=1076179 RepID=A0A644X533_9ZZZZ
MENALRFVKDTLRFLDPQLFLGAILASGLGILLVNSATAGAAGGISRLVIVQALATCLGITVTVILTRIDFDVLSGLWLVFYGLAAAAIIFTIFFGRGPTGDSNKNWIYLGFVSIQPAEFVKIAYILIFAHAIEKCKENISSLRSLLYLGAVAGGLLALMALQGDMGNMLVFLFITVAMLFAAGLNWKYFAGGIVLATLAAPLLWTKVLSSYMRDRILFGFRPELDPSGYGYQAIQSKIAIASGQLAGKGYLNGTQVKIIPARETDFIFATAGEEFGLIGCLIVVGVLLFLMLRTLKIAKLSQNDVGVMVCTGFFALLFAQTFENIGMCLALLPVIGITLPFFSYGGSSVLSLWCGVALVMSVWAQSRRTLSFDQY